MDTCEAQPNLNVWFKFKNGEKSLQRLKPQSLWFVPSAGKDFLVLQLHLSYQIPRGQKMTMFILIPRKFSYNQKERCNLE